jgi:uncharacterized protein
MARPSPEQLVEFWNLRTMPTENVRFWQSYVDDEIGPDGKPLCSAIVALLVDDPSVFSDMHRLPTDEIWHFYLGDPIELLLLHPDGGDELVILGQDVLAGQRVQTVVPPGSIWGRGYSLVASSASTATRWRRGSFSPTSRPRPRRS